MGFFEPPNYPRKWSEMSFELKGLFAYHITMMAMMVFGPLLTVALEVVIASALIVGISVLSLRRRRRLGWLWPRIRPRDLAMAFVVIGLIRFFLFAAGATVPIASPLVTPWFLAGVGMGLFFVLQTLRIVHFAEADFIATGQPGGPRESTGPSPPTWKKSVRIVYGVLFLAIWLEAVTTFCVYGQIYRGGSVTRTATQTEALQDKGRVVYVTSAEKLLLDQLFAVMAVGIPAILLSGFAIHFGLRVPLFPSGSQRAASD